MEGILRDVGNVFLRVPRRGPETGGILLGRRTPDGVQIEDFVPVLCEHRFGRMYRLSPVDRQLLHDALEANRDPRRNLTPVGLYRSHSRAKFGVTQEDSEYLAAYFPETERLLLLIDPGASPAPVAGLFVWGEGRLTAAITRREFPFRDAAVEEGPPAVSVNPRRRRKRLGAFGLATVLAGGAIGAGYYSTAGHRADSPAQVAASQMPLTSLAQAPSPEPTVPSRTTTEITALLDRWAAAIRGGSVDQAALLYVSGAARERARNRIADLLRSEERLDAFQLEELAIEQAVPGEASAAFRLQWQSAGEPKTSGQQDVRMMLRNSTGQWRIVSERVETER